MKQIPIGIDIGESEIKFALCDAGSIRRLISEPVPEQLVREGKVVSPEAMSSFLRETAARHRISGRCCAVVLPAALAFTRRTVMPAMTVEQLRINLPYEFRDYITQEKDKYFYDYALLNMEYGPDGEPRQMELMAAAAAKSTIREYLEMFRRAGFQMALAAPEEFAYAALIRLYEKRNPKAAGQEHCFIDLGHSAVRVHIYTGARFEVTRVVDRGGAALDAAIADSLNVDEHIARTYKLADHNSCLGLEACQSVYRSIAVEIMRAINFYGYNNPSSALGHAWLCGGGTHNALLLEHLREIIKLELRPIDEMLPPVNADSGLTALCPAAVGITQQ